MLSLLMTVTEITQSESEQLEMLLEKTALNDMDAFSEIYSLARHSIYGFALSILKNGHDAEDVLQNTLISVYQNAQSYKACGKPMAWILTITKNLCYMRLREAKKSADIDFSELYALASDSDTASEAADKALLEAALKILNNEERQIVMLHAVSGLKFREIASLLDLVLPTVLSKYRRAIGKMKILIEEEQI